MKTSVAFDFFPAVPLADGALATLPNGMGRYLKAGSDFVIQIHYHPTGKIETDQSTIGIYYVDKPVAEALKAPATLVGSFWMANYEMDIPAGKKNYTRSTSYTLPRDVIMVGTVPHMHLLGKSMTATATLPNSNKRNPRERPAMELQLAGRVLL